VFNKRFATVGILIDLLSCITPACFGTLLWVKIPKFLVTFVCRPACLLIFFGDNYYGWWTHTYCVKIMAPRAPVISMKYWRHFVAGYVQLVQINSCLKQSKKPYENYGWFPLQMESIMCPPQNWHFLWLAKIFCSHFEKFVWIVLPNQYCSIVA